MKPPRAGIGRRLKDIHLRLSGRLTPPEQLPPPDRLQSWLLPIADLLMVVMYSRPPGGSLRTARVTPVTICLAAAVFLLVGIPGLWLAISALVALDPFRLLVGVVASILGLASGVLALFGIRQRSAIRLIQHQRPGR
jgi:hypothetical protein